MGEHCDGSHSRSMFEWGIFTSCEKLCLRSPEDLESLKTDADILGDANFEDVAIKALETSAKEFPGPDTTVCLLPQGSEMNFLGVNLGAGIISVFYDTSQSEASLQSTIAHEYHHSTWTEKYSDNYEWDLLDRKSTRLNSSHVSISYSVFC